MHLRKLSVGALIAVAMMTSTVSQANESNTEKIIKSENTVEGSAINRASIEASDNEKMNEILLKNKARSYGEIDKNFEIGESATVTIPAYGYYVAGLETTSKGTTSISIDIPSILKTKDDYISVYVLDEYGNTVIREFFEPSDWKGQSKFIMNVGLDKGKYTVEIGSSYNGEFETNLKFNFAANNNIEVEPNDNTNNATPIKLGTTYQGSLTGFESDVFKITVPKDTRVNVKIKERKLINSEDNSRFYIVTLGNKGKEYLKSYIDGLTEKDLILKKGTNYIDVNHISALMDYSIKVSEITGPFKPVIDKVGDSYNYVTGTTEIGTKVYVKVGSKSYVQANVSSKGNFSLKTGKIKKGTEVRVYAKNSKGQNSSVAVTKSVDTTAPNKPVVNKYTVESTKLTGTTEANAKIAIRINGDSKKVYQTKADSKGNYSFTLGKLTRGTKIEVQATDAAGNYSYITETKVCNYVAAPKVQKLSDIHTKVKGTATKGTTVYAKIGSKYYKAKVDSKGNFSITIPKQKYKTEIKVYAKDAKGDNSKVVSVKVGYAPKKPTISTVSTKSTKVTGKTSKNATVSVKIGSKTYTGKSNSNGNYSIKIPKQKKKTKITVQAQFASTKFKSYSSSTTVK